MGDIGNPGVEVVRLVDRPDLTGALWDLTDLWPAFMLADPIADLYFSRLGDVPDHVLLAVDADVRRPDLPTDGWDGVIRWAWLDHLAGRAPTHLSALEITVAPRARGTGLAAHMLDALRGTARDAGLQGHVAPVRPSRKHLEPSVPMAEYVTRTRTDGLPQDPWVRLHVRAGGRVVAVCPTSMTVSGTLAQWRSWTGLPLDTEGPVEVDGALVPVHVDPTHDHVVYVEPNGWVEHPL